MTTKNPTSKSKAKKKTTTKKVTKKKTATKKKAAKKKPQDPKLVRAENAFRSANAARRQLENQLKLETAINESLSQNLSICEEDLRELSTTIGKLKGQVVVATLIATSLALTTGIFFFLELATK